MNILEKWLEDPGRLKRLKRAFFISLVLIALMEISVISVFHLGHGHFWFENLPAFGSLYGFASCVLIIAGSKFLGRWLMKKEDYYD